MKSVATHAGRGWTHAAWALALGWTLAACSGGGDGAAAPSATPPVAAGAFKDLSCTQAAGGGWCRQQPREDGLVVLDMDFVDARQGAAVATDDQGIGWLYKTADGGAHWVRQPQATPQTLWSVRFIDPLRAWAVSPTGVWRTDNGGQDWVPVPPPFELKTGDRWERVELLDGGRIVVVSSTYSVRLGHRFEDHWARDEAGASWRPEPQPASRYSIANDETTTWLLSLQADGSVSRQVLQPYPGVPQAYFTAIYKDALDALSAILYLPDQAWITGDAGLNWLPLQRPSPSDVFRVSRDRGGGLLQRGTVLTPGLIRLADPGLLPYVLRSIDQGRSWTGLPGAHDVATITGLGFFDALTGLALAANGQLLTTSDGGLHWTARRALGAGGLRASGLQVVGGVAWLIDSDGRLRRSADGGLSWATQQISTEAHEIVQGVQFLDPLHGVAAVALCDAAAPDFCGPSFTQRVYVTQDGGASWARRGELPVGAGWSRTAFVSPQSGLWIVPDSDGSTSRVYGTEDGGLSWTRVATDALVGSSSPVRAVWQDARRVYAFSATSGVARSVDGGRNWGRVDLPALADLVFVDANRGWAISSAGTLLATADGGQRWQPVATGASLPLSSVFALDAQHLWLGGEAGTIFASETGGR